MPSLAPMLSLSLNNFSDSSDFDFRPLLNRAKAADRAGIGRVVVVDHVVLGQHLDEYDGGQFPTGPAGAWLEPMTVLAALASVTSHVRLSTGILLAALRRPAVLAKTAATLDLISGGRLEIGVGVGWQREEYQAAGLPFEKRGRLLDEALVVCRALWGSSPASFSSDNLRFENVWSEPKPVQAGGVPIWVSGRVNQRTLQRIVRFGDGWLPWAEYRTTEFFGGIKQVHEALEAAGRDPRAFQIRDALPIVAGSDGRLDLNQSMDRVPALIEAGVTDFNLRLNLPDDPDRTFEILSTVVEAFRQASGG